jgi:hypothetical protein
MSDNGQADILTSEEVFGAVDFLRRSNVPKFEGCYSFAFHPSNWEDYQLFRIEFEMSPPPSYRLQQCASHVLTHERRRQYLGKRNTRPTAREAWDRAIEIERRATLEA